MFRFNELDMLDAEMLGGRVEEAISAGNRDENALTDLEFNARHPERNGTKLQKSETALVKEWLQLRDELVRPALGRVAAAAPQSQAAAGRPGYAATSPVAASTEESSGRRNQIIAGSLGALALLGIGIAVTR